MPAFTSRAGAVGFYAHMLLLLLGLQLGWIVLAAGIKAEEGVAFRGFGADGWTLAVVLIIMAPTLEELLFRSWLTRSVFLSVLGVCHGIRHLMPFLSLLAAIQFSAYAVMALALIIRAERLRTAMRRADAVLVRWLPVTVPLSTAVFALTHVSNWDLQVTSPWLIPVVVLPQFVSGLMFAYARVRSGLGVAIALHATINTVAVLAVSAGSVAPG
jgi:membrane protease YdiL (CAAX protease family)